MFSPEALEKFVVAGGVEFRQNAISYIFSCPRCLKRNKLYIHKQTGRFVCFVCKETSRFQGKPEFALREIYNASVAELRKLLYGEEAVGHVDSLEIGFADVWDEDDEDFGELIEEEPSPLGTVWPPDVVGPEHPAFVTAAAYLASRGVTAEHIEAYGIRYHPAEKRVVFPYIVNGTLLGWQGRYAGKTEYWDERRNRNVRIPKAMTSLPQGVSGKHVMFEDRLVGAAHCVLAEGPISAIKAHLCGGNVASLGKAVSDAQIATIAKYVKKLYLALDTDAATDITRIVEAHHENLELYLLLPPPGCGDIGDATPEQVLEQFRTAPRLNEGRLMVSFDKVLAY